MSYKDITDEALVNFSQDPHRGNVANVEMMRRLKNSIDKLESSSRIYSKWLVGLTLVLVLLTIALIYLTSLLIK